MAWSQYYAEIVGSARTKATRCGTKETGLQAFIASKTGALRVNMSHWKGKDHFQIRLRAWGDSKFDDIPLVIGSFVAGEGSPVLRLDDRAVQAHVEARAREIMLKKE